MAAPSPGLRLGRRAAGQKAAQAGPRREDDDAVLGGQKTPLMGSPVQLIDAPAAQGDDARLARLMHMLQWRPRQRRTGLHGHLRNQQDVAAHRDGAQDLVLKHRHRE